MEGEVVIFSVAALSVRDLLPSNLILIALAVVFGPILIAPMFLKTRTEATGKRPAILAAVVIGGIVGAACVESALALSAQREALQNGDYTIMSGTYEGAAVSDMTVTNRVEGLRLSETLLAPPGGILGGWARATLPRYVAEGQAIKVAVHDGVYLAIGRK